MWWGVNSEPVVRCLIAKYLAGSWQTRVVPVESVPRYLVDGWLNFCRDPFDLDALREWEIETRRRKLLRE